LFTSSHIYIFVSLHTFWTYCTVSIIFHINLFLELEEIINNIQRKLYISEQLNKETEIKKIHTTQKKPLTYTFHY
jgi:TRAP-type C4-dicarboxylate transport system permease small subunit